MKKLLSILILYVFTFLLVCSAMAEAHYVTRFLTDDEAFPDCNAPEWADAMFVYFLGIGSQDSILIVSGGKSMLIDCGNYYAGHDVYKRLNALGINKIDYAVNTHPHNDHILGFMTLLEHDINIETFYYAHNRDHNALMERFMSFADGISLNTVQISPADDISFEGCDITLVRYPYINDAYTNNSSLVMKAAHGNNSVLLLADITEDEEIALAEQYGEKLKCDIMKLAHHGITLTQYVFLKYVAPEFCVLTNNKSNTPVESLDKLEMYEQMYFSTTNGTLCCVSDGENWLVKQVKLTNDPYTMGP